MLPTTSPHDLPMCLMFRDGYGCKGTCTDVRLIIYPDGTADILCDECIAIASNQDSLKKAGARIFSIGPEQRTL